MTRSYTALTALVLATLAIATAVVTSIPAGTHRAPPLPIVTTTTPAPQVVVQAHVPHHVRAHPPRRPHAPPTIRCTNAALAAGNCGTPARQTSEQAIQRASVQPADSQLRCEQVEYMNVDYGGVCFAWSDLTASAQSAIWMQLLPEQRRQIVAAGEQP